LGDCFCGCLKGFGKSLKMVVV